MQDLATQLSAIVGAAFAAKGFDVAAGQVMRNPRPELGDFQCNGAMSVAKREGKAPREIAQSLVAALQGNPVFADVSIAGPGFINLRLSAEALDRQASVLAADERTGVVPADRPQTYLLDFCGLNMAKGMHVGHLRSTIIGDSLQRLIQFLGHNKISDVHFGDWGLQIGLIITKLQDEQPDLPYFRDDYTDAMDLATPPVTLVDLERMYPEASARMKEDEAYRDRARRTTAEMQDGKPAYRALHRQIWRATQPDIERELKALKVEFDLWRGESTVHDMIAPMIADLEARHIAGPDQGAVTIKVARNDDTQPMPPFMLVSSTDAALYGTTDLATILDRQNQKLADHYIYVVDQRQALHFTQVFRAAALAGYAREEQLEHVGFGTMNGPDGKPFKTRSGGLIKLYDLIATARDKALQRLQDAGLGADLAEAELNDVASMIGMAALKFADLANNRSTNYIFDFDRFVSFEGRTGPYLQYQGVRIKSLLRRAAAQNVQAGEIRIDLPEERALLLALDGFNLAAQQAFAKRAPNVIADHVYNLSQAFSSFYAAAPILADSTPADVRASRLALAELTLKQLELGLGLLGIEIPEKM